MNIPKTRPPLTVDEWDFKKVPDTELIPCLLWEFLRESQTAQRLGREWADAFGRKDPSFDQTQLMQKTWTFRMVINFSINLQEFTSCAICQHFGFGGLSGVSWQKLPASCKSHLSEPCRINPAAFIGRGRHASILARETTKKESIAEAAYTQESHPDGLAYPDSRALLPDPFRGWEAFLLVVDWQQYDDNAIRYEFQKLASKIIGTRPKGFKPRVRKESGRGRKTEWRGKLKDLGLTRIAARYHAGQLKKEMPAAYKEIAKTISDTGPTAVQKKLDEARRRFEDSFHSLIQEEEDHPVCLAESRFKKYASNRRD